MFYDLLVVYPMKSSVNKFYNVMSMYSIQHEFLYNWIRDHMKNLFAYLSKLLRSLKLVRRCII